MEQQTLKQFEARCIQEEPPACQTMCPLHVDARALTAFAAKGQWNEGRKILDRSMPLVSVSAFLCEGPCRPHCRRAEVDDAIDVPRLERLCAAHGRPAKALPLPATGKRVAVLGAGLSSLAVAWELGRKGHLATIFHQGPVGGPALLALDEKRLPPDAIDNALGQLATVRVKLEEARFSPEFFTGLTGEFAAVYLGLDDLAPADLGLESEQLSPDLVTMATMTEKIFAGPRHPQGEGRLFINQLAGAKRAAGSIDRRLQGVSPASAREGEDVYPTRLYTNLAEVEIQPLQPPADPLQPTEEDGRREGGRCIQCQCLECVKNCVYLHHFKGYPKKYGREIYNNLSVVHGLRRANTLINSCAQCGLCREICPLNADMAHFTTLARREMVETNRMPPSAHEFALLDMESANHPSAAFTHHAPGRTESDYLFFPGCQLPASFPGQTAAAYGHLVKHLGAVGLMFRCCGAPARWSGRPRLTAEAAGAIGQGWLKMGRPKVILACASCALFFKSEMPEIETMTLWETLAELPPPEGAVAGGAAVALHDPCASRHDEKTRRAVRSLLKKAEQPWAELPLGGQLTRCCGYGGLAAAANPEMGQGYAQDRADDTDLTILAYCAMCRDRLRSVGKPAIHLFDIMFPLGRLDERATRPAPGLSDRQEARPRFRRQMLADLWKVEEDPMPTINMIIDENLAPLLEERRILRSDIAAVLKEAEANGAMFHNPETGRSLTSLRPRQVTFWVEFSRQGDGAYHIHDAYCHRMVAPGTPGPGADSPASLEGYSAKGGRM